MSVNAELNKIPYVASGSATYPIPFKFTEKAHIKLYVDDVEKVINTHYSVAGENDPDGGTLTIIGTPYADGEILTILREVPATQENSLTENGPFHAKTIESMFDKLTYMAQQLRETLNRSVRFPISSTNNPQITGTVQPRAVILVNEAADGLEMGPNIEVFVGELNQKVSDAQAAQVAAETAQSASETALSETIAAKNEADQIKTDIEQLKSDVITEKEAAITAKEAAEQAAADAAGAATGAIAGLQSQIDDINTDLSALDIGFSVYANEAVANAGAVTINNKKMQIRRVSGNGGAVTLANQALGAGAISDGVIIVLIGTSDTNPVSINFSDTAKGILLNGDIELKKGRIVHLLGDATMDRYLEIARNF